MFVVLVLFGRGGRVFNYSFRSPATPVGLLARQVIRRIPMSCVTSLQVFVQSILSVGRHERVTVPVTFFIGVGYLIVYGAGVGVLVRAGGVGSWLCACGGYVT